MTSAPYADLLGAIVLGWMSRIARRIDLLGADTHVSVRFTGPARAQLTELASAYAGPPTLAGGQPLVTPRLTLLGIGALYPQCFAFAQSLAAAEPGQPRLADLCRSVLHDFWNEDDPRIRTLARLSHKIDAGNLRALIAANDEASTYFRDRLKSEYDALRQQLAGPSDSTTVLLVDAGPDRTTRHLLQQIFPDIRFEAVYFGTTDVGADPHREGVIFHAPHHDPDRPQTALALYPMLLERLMQSSSTTSGLYRAVVDFVRQNSSLPHWHAEEAMAQALDQLALRLISPTIEDVEVLGFGLTDLRSTWQPGQNVLENSAGHASALMSHATGTSPDATFFTEHERGISPAQPEGKPDGWAGSVAIVTRTKNRPLLLRRAARSVSEQQWRNFWWVVVNDGGNPDPVRKIMAASGVSPDRILFINNPQSVGMEAASNLGIRAVDTEFVVIHDDDDQWEPDFLRQGVEFLASPRAAAAGFEGVLSRAWKVVEQIERDQVNAKHSETFMPWISEVPLAQMAVGNFFAPISFLYRRRIYDDIGGYDERLPVLGDWRFNLDFLARANIGFLDRHLAYYHHRDESAAPEASGYVNSVVGANALHQQYFSVVTNGILRDPDTPKGLRLAVANAHQQRIFERNFNMTRAQISKLQARMDAAGVPESAPPSLPAVPTAQGPGPLPRADRDHILRSLRTALPLTTSFRRIAARLRWFLRLRRLHDARARHRYLPKLFHLIPSPADFDHISYLRNHPEIWATRFNGPGEWIPYHHYLLTGIDRGNVRPTLPLLQSGPDDAAHIPCTERTC
ncbi:glycosyltransferase family 2 protein [Paracoccus beibuensis]|uniref:glycosyltransferase family 2 protein n=1 Tax=Paracoccus beibuensis TaxID=547602 RepID=UPI00224094E5|nr:glycosyltransferase family A protein [Paracoccus beibuensis]